MRVSSLCQAKLTNQSCELTQILPSLPEDFSITPSSL